MSEDNKVRLPEGVEDMRAEDAFIKGVEAERERTQDQRLTWDRIARMSPNEINQHWTEVQRVLEGEDR